MNNLTWIWNEDPNLSISGLKVEARLYHMCYGNKCELTIEKPNISMNGKSNITLVGCLIKPHN